MAANEYEWNMEMNIFMNGSWIFLSSPFHQASSTTIKDTAKFWNRALLIMREQQHSQSQLEKLFEEWRLLKKNKAQVFPTQHAKELAFCYELVS